MALLKKGSKGRPVEALQSAINKLGFKPALKVDGIFGPLTEKGVRASQMKLKTPRADGQADDLTIAALKYGKALPKMEVPDVKKSLLDNEAAVRNLTKIERQLKKISECKKTFEKALLSLNNDLTVATTMDSEALKMVVDRQRRTFDAQRKFDAALTKNPDEAAKLARLAESGQDVVEDKAKSLRRSATAARSLVAEARKTLTVETKAMESAALEVEKLYADTLKKLG